MPTPGERYICGGREFWCVGVDEEHGCAVMRSGPSVIAVNLWNIEKVFHLVGALEVGAVYTAKASRGYVLEGRDYTVTAVDGLLVVLDATKSISLHLFATLF